MHNRLHNHFKTEQNAADVQSATAAVDEAVESFDRGDGVAQRATRSLASHPAIAIGAAFAVGLLIGKWVKR